MKLLTILLFLPLFSQSQQLTVSNYETSFNTGFTFFEGSTPGERVNTISRLGSWSGKYRLHREDPIVCYNGNCYSKRKEHSWNSDQRPGFNQLYRWDRFSFYMARSENVTDIKPYIIYQVKQGNGGSQTGGSPPFALLIENDILYATVRWAIAGDLDSDSQGNSSTYNLGPVKYDQWNDVVLYYDYQANNTGDLRLWLNNTEVITRLDQPNYFLNAGNPYPKIGMYRYIWSNPSFGGSTSTVGTIYFDEVARFGPASTFSQVSLTPPPVNQPPTQSITPPVPSPSSTVQITTSATDSDGTVASYRWSYVSGPNVPTLLNFTTPTVTVANMIPGTYVIRSTVKDNSGDSSVSNITVTMLASPPLIAVGDRNGFYRGPSSVIATINTSGGIPPYAYNWTVEERSQFGEPIITNGNTATSTISNLFPGSYIFEVIVTDQSGQQVSAFVDFIVRPIAVSRIRFRSGKAVIKVPN